MVAVVVSPRRVATKRVLFGAAGLLALTSIWFVVAMLPRERLRVATIEAHRVCLSIRDKGGCLVGMSDRNPVSDPWKRPYVCVSMSGSEFEVVSYGADGISGGRGGDADVHCRGRTSERMTACSCAVGEAQR
jgi:hypothetical protein